MPLPSLHRRKHREKRRLQGASGKAGRSTYDNDGRLPDQHDGRGCLMAHAVLTQRLLVGGAALVGLFLVVLLLVVGFALLAMAVDRYRQTDVKQAEFTATTRPAPAATSAVLDTEPGIDLALADECALILAATTAQETGWDRLRAAIRDEQQKGDQV